jgi:16S rRNA A1518/A1519 N6-dimethyltransferase RsmA/KsgA/DIM1 with predicted DNA glycosylase/AP lyase activity
MEHIPNGKKGIWEIQDFEVDNDGAKLHNLRCILTGNPTRAVLPGKYKRLMKNGLCMMSNTPAEIYDHIGFMWIAKEVGGHILINGLGLGVALAELVKYPNITKITVIELDQDVIDLVGPHLADYRQIEIIKADAFEHKPPKGQRYTAVWHDIWIDISSENLPEMHKLHRKYGRRCDWQGSWARQLCEKRKKEENKAWWTT